MELSKTNKTSSAFSNTSLALLIPICSTKSSDSLIPAVSIKFNVILPTLSLPSTISLVVPA